MDFKVFDNQYESRLYMHFDDEIQFSNREATVPDYIAYHMSRSTGDDLFVEKKFVPFNPDSWDKEKRMIWAGNLSVANGFGMVAENTIKELIKLGVNVLTPGGRSGSPISGSQFVDDLVDQAIGKKIKPDCLEIQHVQPPAFKNSIVERRWMYTMFETDHTPKTWIKMMNKAEHIIVPSLWLVDSWKEQGVTVPIDVVGHGIDPSVYYYMEREEDDVYTFVHSCQLSIRKGTDIVTKAFIEEFKDVKDVKLILKNTAPFFPVPYDLPNVEYIHKTMSKNEMRKLLLRADCAVYPSRGEGFGLAPFEAMATGLPTIVTNWSGCKDYSNPEDTLLLDYKMKRALEFDQIYDGFFEVGENSGYWAEPSYEDVRAKMRWCYENRNKAKEMGRKASERIGANWKWSDKIKELYNIIDTNI